MQLAQIGGQTEPSAGSGFLLDAEGLVVPASDLVAGSAPVNVTLDDGTR